MLRWRLIASVAIITPLLVLFHLDFHHHFGHPGVWLWPVALLLAVLAAGEVLPLMTIGDVRPLPDVVFAGTLLIVGAAGAPLLWIVYPPDCPVGKLGWPVLGLAAGTMVAFLAEIVRYKEPGRAIAGLALSILPLVYVGVLMSFLVQLRLLGGNEWGMVSLLSLILVVKGSDIGAYTCGRLLGRHKLIPRISPGKTIEGTLGGLVSGCLVSWLVFYQLAPLLVGSSPGAAIDAGRGWGWLVYGLIVTLAGMLGDLAESLLKRDAGRKDSSSWLPGLGGVLDVIDSLLLAAPAAFVSWVLGLVGP